MKTPPNNQDAKKFTEYMKGELEAAAIYRLLANNDNNLERGKIFEELHRSEMRHAIKWATLIGIPEENIKPNFLTPKAIYIRIVSKIFGSQKVLPWLSKIEAKEINLYANDVDGKDLVDEEVKHAKILAELSDPSPTGKESLHRYSAGGSLRAAVLGVNDGLISNFCLILGMVGGAAASGNSDFIVIAGLAGLAAGSLSMASGEYISMKSQKEIFQHQIEVEKFELTYWPEEELEELVLIYRAKGLSADIARKTAEQIMKSPKDALDTMAREELGLNPDELGSEWGAAFSSLVAFSVGALVPLVPFLFNTGLVSVYISMFLTAFSLVIIGGSLALVSARSIILGSLRMLAVGGFSAAITYGIGYGIGNIIS